MGPAQMMSSSSNNNTSTATPFLCSLCPTSKSFTRKAHLERHIRTHHSVGSPLNCHFCSKEFRRSDLLKEHHIRCEFRGDRPIPVGIVGRKRRACDRCSQRKISCTGQIPCDRCITAGVVCEKTSPPAGGISVIGGGSGSGSGSGNGNGGSGIDTSQQQLSLSWQTTLTTSSTGTAGSQGTPRGSELDSSVPEEESDDEADNIDDDGNGSDPPDLRGSIEYLLNGQSQGSLGFVQVFPLSATPDEEDSDSPITNGISVPTTATAIPITISSVPQPTPFDMDFSLNYDASILPDIDLNMLFGEMGYLMNIGLEPNALWDPHLFSEHSSPATTTDLDVYDAHASFLRPELFKVVQSFQLPEGSPEYRRAVETVESVTGDLLQRFTNSFFRHWHKHGPIIHIPSYSPSTCATVLILAMCCIGGLYVKDAGEIRRCRGLLDIAEVYIFGRDYLKNEYEFCAYSTGNSSGKTYKDIDWEDFEKLQAAYLMIVVQTWAGHKIAKRRIRQQRFARVVELARQLRLPSAHHTHPPASPADFRAWVRTETAIRLQNIMLTMDCAFVIFNNCTPRISGTEIEQLDLPCASASFSAASFAQLMAIPSPPVRGVKVMKTLRMSFVTPWPTMPVLTTMDLFVTVHVLYVLLTLDLSSQITPTPTSLAAMRQGIDFWMKSWNAARHRYQESDWKSLGLERTSDRYWVLVKAVFLAFEKDIKEGRRRGLCARSDIDESGQHLKEFLAKRK
ncbi:hypothetical protein TWF594_005734 [Orbilia oligospora]|nr:hypothetical protein TWF706_004284 [Orbilia oligospora]KAF3151978.1 hypothetical protein TWF594_005734 [Orbilia oligospora]